MLTRDRLGALLMLVFSLGYGVMIFDIPLLPFQANQAFTARTMPQALSVLGIVLSLALLLRPVSAAETNEEAAWRQAMRQLLRPTPADEEGRRTHPLVRVALLCALMVVYGLTVRPFGFLLSTTVFLAGGMFVLGERRLWLLLGVSIAVTLFFWVLMTQFLGVYIAPLPQVLGR
ncbi:tripartite tricarboxylate transporter TctB family protein [Stappia taiwanensis]|uniref:Tripartite tricarboxylate transporter TctB family protein n=1 Tax=Stappia taiwanensis TaxID=992267 RepID=A0A838XY37_9HYPH|nr:tripartite tricarboxylate transporter TctB family protein [Stappia taiwanensis]MBA4611803.1 tripartite tricarboxylate transporter TctB family protein [Stappia taiwanensis]GGF02879.1 tricarboxylic transport TctB [Stappia taiwanensis]